MNTHDKYALPPLPKPAMNEGDTALYAAFAGSQLTAYARAAIEADRKRRGEPIAWVKPDIVENQFINMRPRRIWWECNEGIGMPIYTAPQPGEPVAWLYEDELPDDYPYDAMFRYSKVDGVRVFPVYAPQPAEPVKGPSDADAKHIQDFIACDGMGAVIVEGPQYSAVVRALLARYGKGTP